MKIPSTIFSVYISLNITTCSVSPPRASHQFLLFLFLLFLLWDDLKRTLNSWAGYKWTPTQTTWRIALIYITVQAELSLKITILACAGVKAWSSSDPPLRSFCVSKPLCVCYGLCNPGYKEEFFLDLFGKRTSFWLRKVFPLFLRCSENPASLKSKTYM